MPRDMTFGDGSERRLALGLSIAAGVLILAVAAGLDRLTFDMISGGLTLLALGVVTFAALHGLGRRDRDPAMARLFQVAFTVKIAFSFLRLFVNEVVYDGSSDAGVYTNAAGHLAPILRSGRFMAVAPGLEGFPAETQRLGLVVAVIFVVTGASTYAGMFAFTTLCFWGQVLMCRAVRVAVPDADQRHYTLLVMFVPSLLYWPSSIGKDAVMIFAIGLASFGAALLLARSARLTGLLVFLAGVAALGFIRPHLSLIAVCALLLAAAVGAVTRVSDLDELKASGVRILAVVALLVAAAAATTQVSEVLGGGAEDESSLTSVLDKTAEQTSIGGSSFEPVAVTSPLDVPMAIVTVVVRPFPWEAGNAQGLIAAGEGMILVGLFVLGRRRLLAWPAGARAAPYLVYAAAFSFVFIIAFSYVGNFGILARQRTQMLPLLFVFLAMPPRPRTRAVKRALDRRGADGPVLAEASEPVSLARRPSSTGAA